MNAYYAQWDDLDESDIRSDLEISDEDYDIDEEEEEFYGCHKCLNSGCNYCLMC